jgi:mRNA-degrading endonuclease RelE of RelBE toxin-antitoxin system
MRYRLKILPEAKRSLRQMPPQLAELASETILELAEDPFPPDSKPLVRQLQDRYRVRVNGWRIIYAVNERDRVVAVLAVRPRDKQTYLNLP